MKEKSYETVSEKKILKILTTHPEVSKNKIMSLANMSRKRCAETLDGLLKGQYVILQNERYEITEQGSSYLEEMAKRDKQGRQAKIKHTGRRS